MRVKVLGGVAVAAVVTLIAFDARDSLSRGVRVPAGTPAATVDGSHATRTPPAVRSVSLTGAGAPAETMDRPGQGAVRPAAALPQRQAPARGTVEDILQRASDAYHRAWSLRADFVQVTRNPLLGSTTTSRGTLYQRRPGRLLLRFSQPRGDVIVSDGRFFWIYYPSVDAKQVIRAPAARGAGAVDLQAQFLGDPLRRFNAQLLGTETVGGRATNVVRMVPKAAAPYKELKVWLDRADNLARRFEVTENNGSVRRFDFSGLRVNTPMSDALFRFQPPAGARVVDQG